LCLLFAVLRLQPNHNAALSPIVELPDIVCKSPLAA
jgi:hypothetical protein